MEAQALLVDAEAKAQHYRRLAEQSAAEAAALRVLVHRLAAELERQLARQVRQHRSEFFSDN